MSTTSRNVHISSIYLYESGYGPSGDLTRYDWRKECLEKLLNSDKNQFLAWQKVIKDKSLDRDLPIKNYALEVTETEDLKKIRLNRSSNNVVLDFSGQNFFGKGVNFNDYEFLFEVDFRGAIFGSIVSFENAIFDKSVFFDWASFESVSFSFARFNDIHFENVVLNGSINFGAALFNSRSYFQRTVFKSSSIFQNTEFVREVDFSKVLFNDLVAFANARFLDESHFFETKFLGLAYFSNTLFEGRSDFYKSKMKDVFFDYSTFNKVTFLSSELTSSSFSHATFTESTEFNLCNFSETNDFSDAIFEKYASFENCRFDCVANFNNVFFKTRFPSFVGCSIGSTRVEFSDEGYFPKSDFSHGAIKKISFLKRLSDEHGQLDQAIDFNAMELRAKRQSACYKLKPENHKDSKCLQSHLSWRVFIRISNLFKGDFWFCVVTFLYEKTSDFGRSYTRPLFLLIGLMAVSYLFGISSAYQNSPALKNRSRQPIFTELSRVYVYESDYSPFLKLSGYRAAMEYSLYRSGNFLDFSDADKNTASINMRLFGSEIEPWWARLFGFFKGIFTAILLFLIALGLRNKYRVG